MAGLLLVALGVALVDSDGCDGGGVVVVADRVIQYSRTLGNPQSDLAIYYRCLELLATGMTGKPSPRGTTPIHTTGSSHSSISRAMVHKRGYTHRSCVAAFLARTTYQKTKNEQTL